MWNLLANCESFTKRTKWKNLWNLQKFQCKPHDNLWEAYEQMKRLNNMTQTITKAQTIQF